MMKKLRSILVLDLGSSYIKLVEVETHGLKPVMSNFSVNPIPSELLNVSAVNNPLFADFIKNKLSQKGISAKDTIICISHPHLEIKGLVLPAMSRKELKTGIDWQIKDVLSIPLESAVVDYMIQGDTETPEGKKMELCIAAIPKGVAEEYVSLLQALGLTPFAFVIEPQSAWQALKDCPEFKDKKTIALINMGAEKSIISVFSNNKLKLTRNLLISGNRFTDSIASRVLKTNGESLDREKAEFLKCKYGIPALTGITEENVNYQDIFSALRPSLEDLVSELMRFLEYYRTEYAGENIEIIAIYGGTSLLKGVPDYISKNIGISVVSPKIDTVEIKSEYKEEFDRLGSFLVDGIGASLLGDRAIDLLPPEIKNNKKLKHGKIVWVRAWVGFVIAIFLINISLSFNVWLKKEVLAKLKNNYEKLASLKEELYRYNAMVNEYNNKTKLANELVSCEPFWEDLLKELASAAPNNIVINEFALNPPKEISYSGIVSPLIITGVVIPRDSPPEEDLTKFLRNLEKSRYFHKIKLEYSKEAKYKEEKVLEFKIGCDVK